MLPTVAVDGPTYRLIPSRYPPISAFDSVTSADDLETVMTEGARTIADTGFVLDYFEARQAETLAPIRSIKDGPVRLLVAAKIGTTRLIDNMGV